MTKIKALRMAYMILLCTLMHTGYAQVVQNDTVYLKNQHDQWIKMSRAEYIQQSQAAYSLLDIGDILGSGLGLARNLTNPKGYDPKDAMKAAKLQRKELKALLKWLNKELITPADYHYMITEHRTIKLNPGTK